MKILIVEDQPEIRETLKDLLEFNGHEVIAAEDGVEGVKLVAQRPEFIFCDVEMPHLDGHGFVAAIKKMPAICEVPFVFLTARVARAEQREGMALGADDYITKPFTERDILDAIAARTKRQLSVRERIHELSIHHQREINAQWSHELFTPLNAVIGSLELLEAAADGMNPAEVKEILAIIRAGAERQERLARKLIRYFSLEQLRHATKPPPPARGSGPGAIEAAAAQAGKETNRANLLEVSAAPGEVALRDDMLRDAVYELVLNALTFAPANTPVVVRGDVNAGTYRIEVTDQGPGLTAAQCAQVGPFTQFERQKREQQGLGLGLAIAQTTAQLAGGRLTLDAGPAGRGLQIVLTLPIAAA